MTGREGNNEYLNNILIHFIVIYLQSVELSSIPPGLCDTADKPLYYASLNPEENLCALKRLSNHDLSHMRPMRQVDGRVS